MRFASATLPSRYFQGPLRSCHTARPLATHAAPTPLPRRSHAAMSPTGSRPTSSFVRQSSLDEAQRAGATVSSGLDRRRFCPSLRDASPAPLLGRPPCSGCQHALQVRLHHLRHRPHRQTMIDRARLHAPLSGCVELAAVPDRACCGTWSARMYARRRAEAAPSLAATAEGQHEPRSTRTCCCKEC